MKNELKPCPFCGGAAYLDVFEYRGRVYEAVFCDEYTIVNRKLSDRLLTPSSTESPIYSIKKHQPFLIDALFLFFLI